MWPGNLWLEFKGRAQACREIARMVKPGGTALISDYIKTGLYQKVFAEAGTEGQPHRAEPTVISAAADRQSGEEMTTTTGVQ